MNKILEFYNIHKKIIIASSIVFMIMVLGMVLVLNNIVKAGSDSQIDIPTDIEIKNESNNEETENIKINIKGAVKNPGVYELNSISRVIDAIEISGGLTKDADTSILNLSKKLKDEDVIIVYNEDEVNKIKEGNIHVEYIEKECNCPNIQNDACIDIDKVIDPGISKDIDTGKISINTATKEQLQTLTGIGISKAEDIIEYRNINGNFESIEDIMNVKGIGQALFEKIKDNITI